jgi:hypothetical protein
MKGEQAMNESNELTMSPSERAQLEALLDAYLAEARQDKVEHERLMAQVDQNLREARRQLALVRANLEKPCGRNSSR